VARLHAPSRFPRTGQRRSVSWVFGPTGSIGAATASTSVFSLGLQFLSEDLTVVRTRGELLLGLSTVTSALDGFGQVAFGMCIVNENASGIGVTAVPSPFDDIGWDGWLVYWTGALFGVSTTVDNAEGLANVRIPIDSKAMRKTHATDVMLGVIQFSTEIGAAVVTAKLNSRVLVKLP